MGVEYYLIKQFTKEKFELGKGQWPMILPTDFRPLYMDEISLYSQILGRVAITFSEDMTLKYFKDLAKELREWCGYDNIMLVGDSWGDGLLDLYIQTGTRYKRDP